MRDWLCKFRAVWMLALAGVPVGLVFGALDFPDRLWLCWIFALLYALAAMACLLIKGRRRLIAGAALASVILFAGAALLPWREKIWLFAIPLGYAVLLLYTLPMAGWESGRELPFSVSLSGAGLFAGAQIMQMIPSGVYAAIQTPLLAGFLVYAVLWLLALNRQSLQEAAARGNGAPESMKRKNKLLTIGLMALVLLLSAIPAIARALAWTWEKLLWLMGRLAALLAALLPDAAVDGGAGGGEAPMGLGGEVTEPGLLAVIMEKIFLALTLIVLAAALAAGARIAWKKLRVFLRRLWQMLGRYALAASEDYVDEVSDTREDGADLSSGRRSRRFDWLLQVNEEKLTPVERVRYRYRRLMKKHQEWLPGSTARENLPIDAAVIYERARYGRADVSQDEAESFAHQAKTLEKKG